MSLEEKNPRLHSHSIFSLRASIYSESLEESLQNITRHFYPQPCTILCITCPNVYFVRSEIHHSSTRLFICDECADSIKSLAEKLASISALTNAGIDDGAVSIVLEYLGYN